MVRALADDVRVAVLVEGESDRAAVQRLAELCDRDLELDGVAVVAMGGATNVATYVDAYGPAGADIELAGLCDHAELGYFVRATRSCGLIGAAASRSGDDVATMASVGFFTCDADLEEELIRSIGVDGMIRFIDARDELQRFRTFQNQPAQRDRTIEQHLWRFIGTRATRKVTWAPLMVEAAVDAGRVPLPLERLIDWV